MRRFCANIAVSGSEAFAEEEWPLISIRDVRLRRIKRDGRCVVITGGIAKGKLRKSLFARSPPTSKFNKRACFGSYRASNSLGKVSVSDILRTS